MQGGAGGSFQPRERSMPRLPIPVEGLSFKELMRETIKGQDEKSEWRLVTNERISIKRLKCKQPEIGKKLN